MKTPKSAALDAVSMLHPRFSAVDAAAVPLAPAVQSAGHAAALRAGIRVDRAVTELRRGRPVILSAGAEQILVAAIETMLPSAWVRLLSDGGELSVTLTAERVQASGWHKQVGPDVAPHHPAVPLPVARPAGADTASPATPITLSLPTDFEPARLADLAGLSSHGVEASTGRQIAERWSSLLAAQAAAPSSQTTPALQAALELARLGRLVPAVVALRLPARGANAGPTMQVEVMEPDDSADPEFLRVSAADIQDYPQDRAVSLLRVSEAPVPLAGQEDSRFVLFREAVADLEHVAIIVGSPDPAEPVLVRLHSSCLTGDLFSSLRCDCGDQLRGAIERLGDGGGVLLYLAQEGRGIGLANKLRAYARQDTGLDTIDADRYLGFRGDERNFAVAVQMLRTLGIRRIRLLTNNPTKIAALRQAGLDVVERLPIGGQLNRHNERYIATKRDRAGHLIDVSTLPVARQAR